MIFGFYESKFGFYESKKVKVTMTNVDYCDCD